MIEAMIGTALKLLVAGEGSRNAEAGRLLELAISRYEALRGGGAEMEALRARLVEGLLAYERVTGVTLDPTGRISRPDGE